MILTFGFILVTPLDIIVQTWGAPSTWLKTFIVIMACALFLLFCLIIYFLRLYQSRVMLNQIPSKSVYIPLEKHDLPSDVRRYIEGTLRRCLGDIKVTAGPLHNKNEIINFPGASPPEYIQQRNIAMGFPNEGTHLPPNCVYEDILDSLGMYIRYNGLAAMTFDIPECYTFRETTLSMVKVLIEKQEIERSRLPEVRRMIKLYEKLKFGPERIKELGMVEFLTLYDQLQLSFHSNRLQLDLDDPQPSYKYGLSRGSLFGTDSLLPPQYNHYRRILHGGALSTRSGTRSEFFADVDQDTDYDGEISRHPTLNELNAQRISRSSTGHSDPDKRLSGGSAIKNKLAFRGRSRERGSASGPASSSSSSSSASTMASVKVRPDAGDV